MPTVASASDFFERYVPERFAREREHFSGVSSHGSLVFRVAGRCWSLRLADGQLKVEERDDDAVLYLSFLDDSSFTALIAPGLKADEAGAPEQRAVALRALSADKDQVELVRQLTGSLELEVEGTGRAFVSTRGQPPTPGAVDCKLSLSAADFAGLQLGQLNPLELFMAGRLSLTGDPQLPLALASLFA